MPWYRVQLHGSGIDLRCDNDYAAVGFYTHRDVSAADPASARRIVVARVLDEWRGDGAYVAANLGSVPTLTVEDCRALPLWKAWFGRRAAGYTFYCRED